MRKADYEYYIDDDKILEDKYFKSLPKDIIRDIKIKKLIK